MNIRPKLLYTSGYGLFRFMVVILIVNWTNASNWSWDNSNRYPVLKDMRNNTLETQRLNREYASICRDAGDCRENAYICRSGSCNCAFGYKLDEKMGICLGAIGSKCMYDSHCIRRAYCKGQTICTCKLEYPVVSSDKWSCGEFGSKAALVLSSLLNSGSLYILRILIESYILLPGLI